MTHVPSLIQDLAIILALASLVSLVFKKINQPIVLGYILVGFLVSPHFPLLPTITDESSIKVWAELGVIFFLFSLGLEFSFKKLLKLGFAPIVIGVIEIGGMFVLGTLLGRWIGFGKIETYFMGAMVAISSTTIILKTFEEKKLKFNKFANLVISILIVEDLAAILLIVFLTSVAATQTTDASLLGLTILKLALFLIVWFVSGFILLPTLIRKAKKILNDETTLILALGLCLSATVLAASLGFSTALGAFLMGSLLAETSEAHHIEKLTHSLKNLFGAIFFVSIGILIDPTYLQKYWLLILQLSLLVIFGKIILIALGALVAGIDLKTALRTSSSMAQIGEFSFIMATLGITLNAINPALYPVAVSTSVITTFLTPFLIQFSPALIDRVMAAIPSRFTDLIARYSLSSQIVTTSSSARVTILNFFIFIVVHVAFILVLDILVKLLGVKFFPQLFHSSYRLVFYGLSLLLTLPLYWALYALPHDRFLKRLLTDNSLIAHYYFLRVLTVSLVMLLSLIQLELYFTKTWYIFFIWPTYFLLFKAKGSVLSKNYSLLESKFYKNFFYDPLESHRKIFIPEVQIPWDIHLAEIHIPENFSDAGRTLQELKIRERFGISVAMIKRHNSIIHTPMRWERVFPQDVLSVIGSDEQLANLASHISSKTISDEGESGTQMRLATVIVEEDSTLAGKSIRESRIREVTQGLVIGIERAGARLVNPDSLLTIESGDVLWLALESHKLADIEALARAKAETLRKE